MLIHGLILAGGEGRRMGGADKALLPLAGRTLLDQVLDRFAPQVAGLALSANGDPARLAGFCCAILADTTDERLGPMAGLAAGLNWLARQGGTHLATVPVDVPFIPCDLVARLADAVAGDPGAIAVAESGGRLHPTCGLWPVMLGPALSAALAAGERRIGHWALAMGARPVAFAATEPDQFLNVNTPADLAAAEAVLAAG
ncbi:MAG: molybdenum cofactor guanylyltransferase [Proteobacteria bacterium]|nr:molybdenum cofactor guanylyltransferase [Pseudomonadota bacterium]MBS0572715.1 molybdenum cofactor guanylyltransferase [Pseudomonadota bacterium]